MARGRGGAAPEKGLYTRNGIFWGRVTVAGCEHRRSLQTRNRAEAQKRLSAWRTKLIDHAKFGINTYSWLDAAVEWEKQIAAAVKPGTLKRYQSSLRTVGPFMATMMLAEIDRKSIAGLVATRRGQGATTATIRRDLTAVSSVFDAAIAAGMSEANPAREFVVSAKRMMRERRDPIVLPDAGDIAYLLERVPPTVAAMIRLARATGMRLQEITDLERRAVDMTRRTISLTKTKTGRGRVVPLTDEAVAAIRSVPVNLASPFVFWRGSGVPYVNLSSGFARMVRSAQSAAQSEGRRFRPFRFHDLRHLAAVEMLRRRVSIYDAQRILGHASIKTTELYLSHMTPEEAELAKRPAQ